MARDTPGGIVLTGGERPSVPGFESGYFYSTTLIEGLPRNPTFAATRFSDPSRRYRAGLISTKCSGKPTTRVTALPP